jgi:hypothetical protein
VLSATNTWIMFEQVMVGHEEWCDTNTRVNTRIQAVRQELENSQKAIVDVDAEVDDINMLYEEKGLGPHLLLIDFVQTTPNAVQYPSNHLGKEVTAWIWKHRITGAEVRRFPTQSGKGFNTGVLSRYLQGLKPTTNKAAYECAQLILLLNSKKTVVDLTASSPSKPALSRGDLLKQWVLYLVCFVCCSIAL